MNGNEEIFSREMSDNAFRLAAHQHLAKEIFKRVRGTNDPGNLKPKNLP